MSENLKDILTNLSKDIDQETLLLYLQEKLSEEKKHEVEKHLLQDNFGDEAIEGLAAIKDKQQIQFMVDMLNRDLKKKTEKKLKRRDKLNIKDQPWILVSILILILLIVLAFFVIHRLMNK